MVTKGDHLYPSSSSILTTKIEVKNISMPVYKRKNDIELEEFRTVIKLVSIDDQAEAV